ncbi:MAG: cytochrome c biogenesis protein CcsA [Aquisalimonadaceae bacterium]
MEHTALILLTIALYLLAGLGFSFRLLRADDGTMMLRPAALGLGTLAVLGHAVILYSHTLAPEGLNLGFFNAGSLVGWLMAILVLLAAIRMPIENLAVVIMPVGAVALALAAAFAPAAAMAGRVPAGLEAHILSSVLAFSVLSIAMIQAMVLAYQDHNLRNRRPGGLVRMLPPLQVMEDMLFQMLTLGFLLLSVALVSGVLFLDDIFAQHLVHKTILSIAAWLVFATLLYGRWRYGWRGRTAIRWTLGGFLALLLAYFGTKLVLELILQR